MPVGNNKHQRLDDVYTDRMSYNIQSLLKDIRLLNVIRCINCLNVLNRHHIKRVSKGLFRLDAPTSNRRHRHCIKMITQPVQDECSDWFVCFSKPAHRVLRSQIDADVSSLNAPLYPIYMEQNYPDCILDRYLDREIFSHVNT